MAVQIFQGTSGPNDFLTIPVHENYNFLAKLGVLYYYQKGFFRYVVIFQLYALLIVSNSINGQSNSLNCLSQIEDSTASTFSKKFTGQIRDQ